MLDSAEGVCAGQARFEYPATTVLLVSAQFVFSYISAQFARRISPPAGRTIRPRHSRISLETAFHLHTCISTMLAEELREEATA
jgi:hypothetical protein